MSTTSPFGPNAHPMIKGAFVPSRTHRLLSLFRRDATLGNISYYVNDDVFLTRVYLYNYFKFLGDGNIPATYVVRCYDRSGKEVAMLTGALPDAAVIELTDVKGLDSFGVFRVHIIPALKNMLIPTAHASLFFNEYYHPCSSNAVIAHSLHVPTPRHSNVTYHRTSPGVMIPEGYRPFVLIAGGCSFPTTLHPYCGSATISITNEEGRERTISAPSLKPLSCERLDLFALDPELREHIGPRPFILRISGKDFLSKPFIFITNGTTTVGEHL